MGHRALRLDHVNGFCYLRRELRGLIHHAKVADTGEHGTHRAGHTLGLRCRHSWHWCLYYRSARWEGAIDDRLASHHIRHERLGAAPIRGVTHQSEFGSQKQRMVVGAAGTALDRRPTTPRLPRFRDIHGHLCSSVGPTRVWSGREYWLAPSVCVVCLYGMAGNFGLAGYQGAQPKVPTLEQTGTAAANSQRMGLGVRVSGRVPPAEEASVIR